MNADADGRLILTDFRDAMSADELFSWLSIQLDRLPEPRDLYQAGSTLYEAGHYAGAATALRLYVDGNGAETPGHHLLGYALHMLGESHQCAQELRRCCNAGFDQDWQLLVESQLAADASDAANEKAAQRAAAAAAAAATVRGGGVVDGGDATLAATISARKTAHTAQSFEFDD
jgi:hypothetical protein